METRTYNVYKFSELSDEGKEKALERYSNINVDDPFWYECIVEDTRDVGVEIEEFDLYHGTIKCRFTDAVELVAGKILAEHGKDSETYKTADGFLADFKKLSESEKGDDLCNEFRRSLSEDYRLILQRSYDYLTSREAIIETLEANEYDFTAEGVID